MAQISNDQPSQIISNVAATTSHEIQSCLPRNEALRQQIKRARRVWDEEIEPNMLDDFQLPDAYYTTLNRMDFAKDIKDETERISLVTASENLKWLKEANVWIMDGTFKTVPTLFQQLYSIHAPVGENINFRVVTLAYVLMSSESEELYQRLFQELNECAEENQLELNRNFVLTDFEKAPISEALSEFLSVQSKRCHFYLDQFFYRQIQDAGLTKNYRSDQDFSLLIGHIPVLALLSRAEIPDAFDGVKALLPTDAGQILQWFENNYVHGRVKRILRNGTVLRHDLLYPPAMWSVFDNTELAFLKTQNKVKAWHRRWKTLIGYSHGWHFHYD